jgi:hypothetical protein
MPNDKRTEKWVLWFLTVGAVFFGVDLVYSLLRGDMPQLNEIAIFVMFAAIAVEKWLKRRKDADGP